MQFYRSGTRSKTVSACKVCTFEWSLKDKDLAEMFKNIPTALHYSLFICVPKN